MTRSIYDTGIMLTGMLSIRLFCLHGQVVDVERLGNFLVNHSISILLPSDAKLEYGG